MEPCSSDWREAAAAYVFKNIFDLLTVGLAVFIFIRGIFSPYEAKDVPFLLSALVGLLALIGGAGLWERHRRLDAIQQATTETRDLVERRLSGRLHAAEFFGPPNVGVTKQDVHGARQVYVVGMVLDRTMRDMMTAFAELLSEGAELKVVVLDPHDSDIMKILPRRSYGSQNSEWWKQRIEQTVGHIFDIPKNGSAHGSLEIGYLPFFPSFGMILIDPKASNGRVLLEIYHHRTAEVNPSFSIQAQIDPFWFDFFQRQFDVLWNSCLELGRHEVVWPRRGDSMSIEQ